MEEPESDCTNGSKRDYDEQNFLVVFEQANSLINENGYSTGIFV